MIIPASLNYYEASDFQIVEVVATLPSKWRMQQVFELLLFHTRFWARLQSCEKRLLASSCLSVRHHFRLDLNNSAFTGQIFMKYDISVFFQKSLHKCQICNKI
jgi:hypothetical protein